MSVETITAKLWQEKVIDSVLPIVVNFSAVRCGFYRHRISNIYHTFLFFYNRYNIRTLLM